MLPYRSDNSGFDIGCRCAHDTARIPLPLLYDRMRDVIAVADAAFVRVRPVLTTRSDNLRTPALYSRRDGVRQGSLQHTQLPG